MLVIGDNRIEVGDKRIRIPTTDWVQEIAIQSGLTLIERIDISVTTEKRIHMKNAIKENVVLWLKKP